VLLSIEVIVSVISGTENLINNKRKKSLKAFLVALCERKVLNLFAMSATKLIDKTKFTRKD
jgi:hypothetical protein